MLNADEEINSLKELANWMTSFENRKITLLLHRHENRMSKGLKRLTKVFSYRKSSCIKRSNRKYKINEPY